MLVENRNFGQKSKLWSKIAIYLNWNSIAETSPLKEIYGHIIWVQIGENFNAWLVSYVLEHFLEHFPL